MTVNKVKKRVPKIWFTLDFELGWGVAENGLWHVRQEAGVYRMLHHRIGELVALYDRFEAPVTWATVGAMVTEPKNLRFDHLPDAARDYLEHYVSNADEATLDGRDLLDAVISGGDAHTVGCHSYSHLRFDFPDYDVLGVQADLDLARSALGKTGSGSNCLVLPQNIEANLEALELSGVSLCRTAPLDFSSNRYYRKLLNSAGHFSPVGIRQSGGVVFQSGTMFFNCKPSTISGSYLLWLLKRATCKAIAQGTDLHFWAHPFNFCMSPVLFEVADSYFRWIEPLRADGKLEPARWDQSLVDTIAPNQM